MSHSGSHTALVTANSSSLETVPDPSLYFLTPSREGNSCAVELSSQRKTVINLPKLYANRTFSLLSLIVVNNEQFKL